MERLTETVYTELTRICPGGVERDVDLSVFSQWRIGGNADVLIRPASVTELVTLRRWLYERGQAHVVIGLSTNLLFADEGLHIPVLQIGPRMADVLITPQYVQAQAGIWVPALARRLMQAGLTGAEHTCGIPGTLGGLICMNGGSQRKGIGSSVIDVESVDVEGNVVRRTAEECDFAYRHSIYQVKGEVITSAKLQFSKAPRDSIRTVMRKILADRRRKFPRKLPNCGSVFKSNPTMYAEIGPPGAAIERAGLKGFRIGAAQVSPLHANFIINNGGAQAYEVLRLIKFISDTVAEQFGYLMDPEINYVTPDGKIVSAYQPD